MTALVQSTTRPLVTTVPEVFALVGETVCARWEAIGQMDSKVHWAYGMEAESLITEGVPSMLAYKAIAIKAGKNSQTIRKAYYTYTAFTKEQRAKYDACPYSVFAIARNQPDPEKVLQEYVNNRCSLDELEVIYPERGDETLEREFIERGYPRMFYGIYREIFGIDPFLKARCEEAMREILDIIKQANEVKE